VIDLDVADHRLDRRVGSWRGGWRR
jgi:hypothetical protein